MTSNTDIIRFLVEKGVALEIALGASEIADRVLMEVLKRDSHADSHVTERDSHRRESDRLRKQRSRDKLRTSRDSHVTERDACTAALVPQVNLSSPSLLKKERKKDSLGETSASPQTKRGTRLPDDWEPEDPDFANEILRDRAPIELEKFRDYWRAQPGAKGVKLDWQATWRNWVRTANERQRGGQREEARNKHSVIAAIDRQLAQLEQERAHPALPESNLLELPFRSIR